MAIVWLDYEGLVSLKLATIRMTNFIAGYIKAGRLRKGEGKIPLEKL